MSLRLAQTPASREGGRDEVRGARTGEDGARRHVGRGDQHLRLGAHVPPTRDRNGISSTTGGRSIATPLGYDAIGILYFVLFVSPQSVVTRGSNEISRP